MAGSNPQFLQVPKALPHRKLRSRSKSRSRESSPTPAGRTAATPPRMRPQSPPVTSMQPPSKPVFNGYAASDIKDYSIPNGHRSPTQSSTYSIHGKPTSHPPAIGTSGLGTSRDEEAAGTDYDDLNGGLYTLSSDEEPQLQKWEQPATHASYTYPQQSSYIPLRQRLVGAWKLESYTAYPTPESTVQRPTYPMTKNVTGLILYTPDGYVSAQMLIPGQQSFKRGEGAEPQWAEAAKRSFTYSGPYYISNEGQGREEILRHTFQYCNLPGWIGDIQVRTCRFEEDGQVLVLGSEEPSEIKGDKRIPVLKWRRARDNSDGVPPPPMPQIRISGPGEP